MLNTQRRHTSTHWITLTWHQLVEFFWRFALPSHRGPQRNWSPFFRLPIDPAGVVVLPGSIEWPGCHQFFWGLLRLGEPEILGLFVVNGHPKTSNIGGQLCWVLSHTKSYTDTDKDDEFCRVTIGKQRSIAYKCCLPKFPQEILKKSQSFRPLATSIRRCFSPMRLELYSGFHKYGIPNSWIVYFMENRMIWGYPYFRKPPYSDLRVPKLRLLFHAIKLQSLFEYLNSAVFCPKTCWSLALW